MLLLQDLLWAEFTLPGVPISTTWATDDPLVVEHDPSEGLGIAMLTYVAIQLASDY